MKRILGCLAAALLSLHAFAQAPEISVVGRAEALYDLNSPFEDVPLWSVGMSSIYAFVEGGIGNSDFSYFASLHLLSREPASLYCQKYPLVNGSWLDAAYMTYDNGTFCVDAGKIFYRLGTFEQEEYDVFTYAPMNSDYWSGICGYLYGLSFAYTPWEGQTFRAQVTTSSYMTDIKSGDLAYSLSWYGQMGVFSTCWAVGTQRCSDPELFGEEGKNYYWIMGLGNRLTFDNFEHTLDINAYEMRKFSDMKTTSFFWRTAYTSGKHFHPTLLLGLEHLSDVKYGFSLEYMPLSDDSLRIYASASNRHWLRNDEIHSNEPMCNFMATVGVMYDLRLSFKKK